MRLGNVIEKGILFAAAMAVNLGLYLLVPYIQVLLARNAHPALSPKVVTAELEFTPPTADKLVKREIKEIKIQSVGQPQPNPARPTMPGGGLKIDLSAAGGEGLALLSGGDRTGGIGSGTGGGVGNGMAAMTYEMGQTDVDATQLNDPGLDYPPRADREGVSGIVDLVFVVNEAGQVEDISVLKEEPTGYGFAGKAIASAKKIRFKPATLQKTAVRQRFKKRFNYDHEQ